MFLPWGRHGSAMGPAHGSAMGTVPMVKHFASKVFINGHKFPVMAKKRAPRQRSPISFLNLEYDPPAM